MVIRPLFYRRPDFLQLWRSRQVRVLEILQQCRAVFAAARQGNAHQRQTDADDFNPSDPLVEKQCAQRQTEDRNQKAERIGTVEFGLLQDRAPKPIDK